MDIKVGYIGLGIMGRPAALNLLRAGYPLWVYARHPETTRPLIERGATACPSPAEVARAADVIFTNLPDTPDVEQVVLGPLGLIQGSTAGKVLVDMSTISPSASRRLASVLTQQGVGMLDSPVSGGEQGAIEGTLSFMVGGPAELLQRVRPLLEVMGSRIVHVGDSGAGQVCKACNQVLVAQSIAAVGEALLLAEASRVDVGKVREALLGGFAYSRILETHGQRMLDSEFTPGFRASLHQKDMRIALDTAAELGLGLPGAALATQLINALVGRGQGELDSSALFTVQKALSGLD